MKDFLYFPSMTRVAWLCSISRFKSPDSHPASDEVDKQLSPLMEELSATGYHTSQKVFTSRQVTLINRHLGSPG